MFWTTTEQGEELKRRGNLDRIDLSIRYELNKPAAILYMINLNKNN